MTAAPTLSPTLAFSIFATVSVPSVLTVMSVSAMSPLGIPFFRFCSDENFGQWLLGIAGGMTLFGYLSDMHLWKRKVATTAASVWLVLISTIFLCGAVLFSHKIPSIPIGLGMTLSALSVWGLRVFVCKQSSPAEYSLACSAAFLAQFTMYLTIWLIWVFKPHRNPVYDMAPDLTPLTIFTLWCSPLVIAVLFSFMAMMCYLRARFYAHAETKGGNSDVQSVQSELMIVLTSIAVALIGCWIAASIAASDMGFQQTIMRISLAFCVGTVIYACLSLGTTRVLAAAAEQEFVRDTVDFLTSDWAKAIFLLLFLPLLPAFLLLEVIHQARRFLMSCVGLYDSPLVRPISDEAYMCMQSALAWNKTSILTKIITVGVVYFAFVSGVGVGVSVFLAWCIDVVQTWSMLAIIALLYGIGMFLFLLPPVPGLPVYLATGAMIVARGQVDSNTEASFYRNLCLAVFVAFTIKLAAITMQMKMIGAPLSQSVTVKKMIGVHTDVMKAVRHVLGQPFTLDKVCILTTGPDWPVSVLTGVLDMRLIPCLVGSLPVIILIAPAVVSGAFMVRKGGSLEADEMYASVASLSMVATVVIQGSAFVLFCVRAGSMTERFKTELESGNWEVDPQEREVLEQIKKDELAAKQRDAVVKWQYLPGWLQAMLLFGAVSLSVQMYMLLLPFLTPFVPFTVVDHIKDLPGGTAWGVIKWPGWAAIGCWLFGILALSSFERWAEAAASECKDEAEPLSAQALLDKAA
mmetsp:Transcript_90205/g.160664  ORF Transcript_90205/g.160664 Transcript_90205/m.160664 type:complete len:746 (+) Transcript_90205:98-2335(+)